MGFVCLNMRRCHSEADRGPLAFREEWLVDPSRVRAGPIRRDRGEDSDANGSDYIVTKISGRQSANSRLPFLYLISAPVRPYASQGRSPGTMAQPARSRVRALFTAIRRGEAGEVVRVLETYPHLLDAQNHWDGRTLLYHAAFLGQTAMVRMLLERGAGVDIKSCDGMSPLFAAAKFGHAEVVLLLLGSGADLRRTNGPFNGPERGTALVAACRGGHLGVVRVLLQHMRGDGLDAKDRTGRTALYWACSRKRPEVTRALLLAGADQTIVAGVKRRTPRQAAVLIGSRACEKVFEVSPVGFMQVYSLSSWILNCSHVFPHPAFCLAVVGG